MKITIAKQDLLVGVKALNGILCTKLHPLLLETAPGSVKLSATRGDLSMEYAAACTVKSPGAVTLPAKRLVSVLSELPNEDIEFELSDSVDDLLVLRCGKIRVDFHPLHVDEVSPIWDSRDVQPITISQKVLKAICKKVTFAICKDLARHNLTGVLLEFADGALTVVAVDGKRMSVLRQDKVIMDSSAFKVIIPGKIMILLGRLCTQEGEVEMRFDDCHVAFSFGPYRVVGKLLDTKFPDHRQVIPKSNDKRIVFDTAQLKQVLKRATTMTTDKFLSVHFHFNSGVLVLKVRTPDVGEYEEAMAVEYSGEAVEIALNPDFVVDVLRRIDSESTHLAIKDKDSPTVWTPADEDEDVRYTNIIMPIRI